MALRLFFGYKASAAAPLTAGVDESLTFTDSPASTALFPASAPESLTLAAVGSVLSPAKRAYVSWVEFQVPLPTPPTGVARAEALSLADQSSATGGATSAVCAESLSAVDIKSASGGNISAFASETLTATTSSQSSTAIRVYLYWSDMQLPTAMQSDAVAEALSVLDAPTAVRTRVVMAGDSMLVVDAGASAADIVAALDEILASVDQAGAIGGATLAETDEVLTALDASLGAGGISPSEESEATTVDDLSDAANITYSMQEEAETLAEVADATAAASMPETVVFSDDGSAVIITQGSFAEATALADEALAATLLWQTALAETLSVGEATDAILHIPPVFEDVAPVSSRTGLIGGRLGGSAPGRGVVSKLD